jgi:hypothetical protein
MVVGFPPKVDDLPVGQADSSRRADPTAAEKRLGQV